jgi:hypothetical protein
VNSSIRFDWIAPPALCVAGLCSAPASLSARLPTPAAFTIIVISPENFAAGSVTRWAGVPEDLVALWWVAADDNSVVPAGTFTAFGFGDNYLTITPARETVAVSLVDTRSPSFKAVSGEAYNEPLRIIVDALARTLPERALGFD